MKKLAHGGGKVYVVLNSQEFTMLTGKSPGNIPSETIIPLTAVKQKLALIDNKKPQLTQLKTDIESVLQKLNQIGA